MDDLLENVEAANSGNETALANLRQQLTGPNAMSIIEACGNLAYQAEESLLRAVLRDQEGTMECIRHRLQQMRIELGWSKAPAHEKIVIEQIVATWLQLNFAEMEASQSKSNSIALAKYNQFRIDRAQRRHLAAIKMLATIRKMALPIRVEINADVTVNEQSSSPVFGNRFAIPTNSDN
ncbi:MAG: hypothetical protein ABL888_17475 [Pirellulaceae bacterium]